jgi:hypothetical protein
MEHIFIPAVFVEAGTVTLTNYVQLALRLSAALIVHSISKYNKLSALLDDFEN